MEKEVTVSSLKSGQKFKANIGNEEIEGKLSIENNELYLCQDYEDGNECTNKQGYKYSWVHDEYVSNLIVYNSSTKRWQSISIKVEEGLRIFDYECKISKDSVSIGCGEVKFTKKQVNDFITQYKLLSKSPVQQELIYRELTMDVDNFQVFQEIAKRMK
jgi:hypothetical protein